MPFAKDTLIAVERSQQEIRALLLRKGVSNFGIMEGEGAAFVAFTAEGIPIQIRLPLASWESEDFKYDGRGRWRKEEARRKAHDQDCRSRWRALKLVIQAKMEAVERGISTLEDEFLGSVVVAGGMTISQHLKSGLRAAVDSGVMPKLLPEASS